MWLLAGEAVGGALLADGVLREIGIPAMRKERKQQPSEILYFDRSKWEGGEDTGSEFSGGDKITKTRF